MIVFTLLLVPAVLAAPLIRHPDQNQYPVNDEEPMRPKAAFKLPPFETWRYPQRELLPVYSNRVPLASFTYPSIVRAHTAPLFQGLGSFFQQHNKDNLLVNMPPSFPSKIFQIQNMVPTRISKLDSSPTKKVLTNMPPPPSQFSAQPMAYEVRDQQVPRVVSPVIKQFRSQDELGGYHFSYSGGPTSRSETRTSDGVVEGSYSYVDPNGLLKRYDYIADSNGYRMKENFA